MGVNEKILVVIPTHNEREGIGILIRQIYSLNVSAAVLVVDDISTDGTVECVRDLQREFSGIFLLMRSKKLGLASAYRDGFKFALEKRFDVVIQMDADLTHHPGFIPLMLEKIRDCDLVIGSRYVQGAKIVSWKWGRLCISRLGNIFARILLRLSPKDVTSGFRCFRRGALEGIHIETTSSHGYVFQIETTLRASLIGLKIIEIPIQFEGRRFQSSKASFEILLEAVWKVVFWAFKILLLTFYFRKKDIKNL